MNGTRLGLRISAALTWVAAASAGCASEDSGAERSPQATGGTHSLPSDSTPLDASAADANATTPADSGAANPPLEDAGAGMPGRDFPDVEYDAFPPAPQAPLCPSGGMLRITPSTTFFKLGEDDTILGSVSPDGLSVAWTVPGLNSPGNSTPNLVFVADRARSSDAFEAPQAVDFGSTLVAADKVALSPDGLRLVAVRSDQQAFVELERSARTDPFGSPSEDGFAAINAAAQTLQASLGDPTIAGDDRAFFYTRALAVVESQRTSTEPWPEGAETLLDDSLDPEQRPRLSAVSSDHLTVFFWDDQLRVETAVWRSFPDAPFHTSVRLPSVPRAQPSASCESLFFASSDPSGVNLASATVSLGP